MKKRASHIYSKRFHTVVPLDDGRVHIQLAEPISNPHAQLWLMTLLGYRRGNGVVTNAGKIIAVIAWPSDWLDLLVALHASKERIAEFLSVVKGAKQF